MTAITALLGHVTPEMTLRYARLASDTVRTAYETAMRRLSARPLTLGVPAAAPMPERVAWLGQELLKTRLAHGFCSRHLAAGPCAYANICETCENFVPVPEFRPVIEGQLADARALRDDAATRGWEAEEARHGRVVEALEDHIRRLKEAAGPTGSA